MDLLQILSTMMIPAVGMYVPVVILAETSYNIKEHPNIDFFQIFWEKIEALSLTGGTKQTVDDTYCEGS